MKVRAKTQGTANDIELFPMDSFHNIGHSIDRFENSQSLQFFFILFV